MFANNNGAIVRKLARRSFVAGRRRNLAAIATIALAVCLMVVLSVVTIGAYKTALQLSIGDTQAYFHQMSEEQFRRIEAHPDLTNVSAQQQLSKIQQGDYTIRTLQVSDNHMNFHSESAPLAGRVPHNYDEIAVNQSMLQYFGLPGELDQALSLDIGYGEETFTVCGILQNQDTARGFLVFVSKEYAEAHVEPLEYTVRVSLLNPDDQGLEWTEQRLYEIASELGLEAQFMLNSAYFSGHGIASSTMALILGLSGAIVIACGIVIYSIFYISISGKIQEYGRLKVIGTTSKMLRRIVRVETSYLAICGIAIGDLTGGIIAYAMVSDGWRWRVMLGCMAAASIVAFLAVCISTRKPMKLAGRVSPVEAIRATQYSDYSRAAASSKLQRRLSPWGLAWISFQRNRKKAVLTLVSLGFAGVLLMGVSTFRHSVTNEHLVRAEFPYGDLYVTMDLVNSRDSTTPQLDNPFTQEMESTVRSIAGVTDVERIYAVGAECLFPSKSTPMAFTGLSREQLERYGESPKEGTWDYDELVRQNGILLKAEDATFLSREFGVTAQVGERVPVLCGDGATVEFTVMGIFQKPPRSIASGSMILVPDELLPVLDSSIDNYTSDMIIYVDEETDQNRREIFALTNGTPLLVVSFQDKVDFMAPMTESFQYTILAIAAFIVLFSLVNLTNTLLTSLYARQREYGVFQSIGMDRSQLRQVLGTECLIYVLGALAIAGTLGTGVGTLICAVATDKLRNPVTFIFPIAEFVVYAVLLLAAYWIYRTLATRLCTGKPLVERIRE